MLELFMNGGPEATKATGRTRPEEAALDACAALYSLIQNLSWSSKARPSGFKSKRRQQLRSAGSEFLRVRLRPSRPPDSGRILAVQDLVGLLRNATKTALAATTTLNVAQGRRVRKQRCTLSPRSSEGTKIDFDPPNEIASN